MSVVKLLTPDEFSDFKSGNEPTFKYVYDSYYDIIFFKVNRLCCQTEISEEIVQEAFVQLYLNKDKLQDATGVYAYLYTVSKRMAISYFRKKVVREQFQTEQKYRWEEACTESQNRLDEKDICEAVDQIIEALPLQQKVIYRMNKFDEKSYNEIADAMGLSKNTVRNHIATASKIVRIKLAGLLSFLFLIKFLF